MRAAAQALAHSHGTALPSLHELQRGQHSRRPVVHRPHLLMLRHPTPHQPARAHMHSQRARVRAGAAMKLHTRDQAPKEGQQPAEKPVSKWEPGREEYLQFLVDSRRRRPPAPNPDPHPRTRSPNPIAEP